MDKETKEYYGKITKGARHTELIRWVWWGVFRKRKWEHMNKKLLLGMRFSLAMHQTKNDL